MMIIIKIKISKKEELIWVLLYINKYYTKIICLQLKTNKLRKLINLYFVYIDDLKFNIYRYKIVYDNERIFKYIHIL